MRKRVATFSSSIDAFTSNRFISYGTVALTVSLIGALAGCSSDDGDTEGMYPATPGAGGGGTTVVGAGGGAVVGTSGAGPTIGASGSSTVTPGAGGSVATPGAGGAPPTPGAGGAPPTPGAGGAPPTPGAGGADPGGMGGSASEPDGGGPPSPPAGPVEPDQPGPYEPVLDKNVGKGFELTIASSDRGDGVAGCSGFAQAFGQDPEQTAEFVKIPPDLDMALYTMYRPAQLEEGKKYPVITWGNGTCALPEGYGRLLRHWASHGFLVIAAHSRQVGTTGAVRRALDFVFAANDDSSSPYYQKVDTDRVGAAGHSQGSAAAGATTTADSRIKTVILLNAGTSNSKPFFAVSGDRDLAGGMSGFRSAVQRAPKAAFIFYHMVPGNGALDGHLTLITEPERVFGPTAAWWRLVLAGDESVKSWFSGSDCNLCNRTSEFDFGQSGLD